jgi:hypothetical protein
VSLLLFHHGLVSPSMVTTSHIVGQSLGYFGHAQHRDAQHQ